MNKKEILNRLRNDEDYYGEFGKQYLIRRTNGRQIQTKRYINGN